MTTLPIEIFSYMQWESTPVVAAITIVQILLILVLGLVVERLVGLRGRSCAYESQAHRPWNRSQPRARSDGTQASDSDSA